MVNKLKLASVCKQIRGVSYTPRDVAESPSNGYIPVLRANNIQSRITLDDLVYVNHEKISEEQLLKEGDILVCASSGSKSLVGKAAMVHNLKIQHASFGAFCKVVRPTKIYAPYLAHFFNSFYYRNMISHIAQGANINNIRNEHLNDLDVPCPSQAEQKKIAERLDKVQELIALQKEQLKKLDELIKSRFIDLFGDPITNPKGWPSKKGKDVFAFSSGQFNPTSNLHNTNPYPCYGGNGVTGYSKDYLIDYSTIVIGRVGAYCGNVTKTERYSWITDNAIFLVSYKPTIYDMDFLFYLFSKLNFHRFANFSGQPKITQEPLLNLTYIMPPLALQK